MRYQVPLFPQTQPMSCWAASIAMILGWRDNACYSDFIIAQNNGGTSYVPNMQNGLLPSDVYMLHRNGFEVESPQCYNPEGIYSLLAQYGPLWFAANVPLTGNHPDPHIRVIAGMANVHGNNTLVYINDPWEKGMNAFRPGNRGSKYSMPFSAMMGQNEDLGTVELSENAPIYVAYLP